MTRAPLLVLLAVAGLAGGYIESCTRARSGARVHALRLRHGALHERLQRGLGRDPVATRALADRGQIVIAVRTVLIEELTARVAQQYLEHVRLDLAALAAHAAGTLRKHTPIGPRKIGDWNVSIVIHRLVAHLRAGQPRLTFASNVLDVDLPIEVQPATGRLSLRFSWDSASVVNLVCKDFVVDLVLDGEALRQVHVLRGQVQLAASANTLTATPVIHERVLRLKLALPPAGWSDVEQALRFQDSLGRCGLFLDPDQVLTRLHVLVAAGIEVRLPRSPCRPVHLPARFEPTVQVNDRMVRLSLAGERLHASAALLWSSTQVSVAAQPRVAGSHLPVWQTMAEKARPGCGLTFTMGC